MKKQKAAVKAIAAAVVSKPLPPKKPSLQKLLPEAKRAKVIAALKRLHPMD